MGLSYSVRFWTNDGIGMVASELSRALGFAIDPTHRGRIPRIALVTLVATEFELDVKEADQITQAIVREDFGIAINKIVQVLVWGSFSTESEGGSQLAALVQYLLSQHSGDLVFLFNEELVLLIRDKNEIVLNSIAGFWNNTNKSLIKFPYVEKPIPVL
jgi:hypothetical protein